MQARKTDSARVGAENRRKPSFDAYGLYDVSCVKVHGDRGISFSVADNKFGVRAVSAHNMKSCFNMGWFCVVIVSDERILAPGQRVVRHSQLFHNVAFLRAAFYQSCFTVKYTDFVNFFGAVHGKDGRQQLLRRDEAAGRKKQADQQQRKQKNLCHARRDICSGKRRMGGTCPPYSHGL